MKNILFPILLIFLLGCDSNQEDKRDCYADLQINPVFNFHGTLLQAQTIASKKFDTLDKYSLTNKKIEGKKAEELMKVDHFLWNLFDGCLITSLEVKSPNEIYFGFPSGCEGLDTYKVYCKEKKRPELYERYEHLNIGSNEPFWFDVKAMNSTKQ